MKEYFEHLGWAVATAADGLEGFRAASRGHFDLITMDIKMPGVNGVDSLRSMHLVGEGARVVVISGFLTSEIGDLCRSAGASAVLEKPVELAKLGRLANELAAGEPKAKGGA
jgi:CheY-like chemotaxis protein